MIKLPDMLVFVCGFNRMRANDEVGERLVEQGTKEGGGRRVK